MSDLGLSVDELERIAALGWQATTARPLGDWLLRAADGFTGRANSVLALGSPGIAVDDALVTVGAFYVSRGLPPRFQVPLAASGVPVSELDGELEARGWTAFDETTVMAAAIDTVLDSCAVRPDLPPAELDAHPSAEWIEGYRYRGRSLPASAVAVLTNAPDPVFAMVRRGDVRLGVARGAITSGWLGITAVTVDPEHRRQGVGKHLLMQLATWARHRGAENIYLQVGVENLAASELYRNAGFVVHHRYHYRIAPSPT